MFSKSSNPILSKSFSTAHTSTFEETMTLSGTINKSITLLAIVLVSAAITWNMAFNGNGGVSLIMPGFIFGFITALILTFKKEWASFLAPLYAVFEGLALGALSAVVEMSFFTNQESGATSQGIVFNAVLLTFGIFFIMLLLYKNKIIQPTQKFMAVVYAGTGAIALVYLVNFIMHLFGSGIPMIHSNGPMGLIFSAVVIVLASLNFILDFKSIEDGVAHNAPKYMEWYGAFGLMVTLIWLYLEVLRLLMKLQSRD